MTPWLLSMTLSGLSLMSVVAVGAAQAQANEGVLVHVSLRDDQGAVIDHLGVQPDRSRRPVAAVDRPDATACSLQGEHACSEPTPAFVGTVRTTGGRVVLDGVLVRANAEGPEAARSVHLSFAIAGCQAGAAVPIEREGLTGSACAQRLR